MINNNGGLQMYMGELNQFFAMHKGSRIIARFIVASPGLSEALKGYYFNYVVPTFRTGIWEAGERLTEEQTERRLRELSPVMYEQIPNIETGEYETRLRKISELSNAELIEHIEHLKQIAAEEYNALAANLDLLRKFGFECEEFGGGSLILRAVPADLKSGDALATLEELAEKLVTAHTADPAAVRDALLHTMACKAAIKGGWKSDLSELRVLVDKVQSGDVQFCPHGRPVKAKLTKYELEKMFKRA